VSVVRRTPTNATLVQKADLEVNLKSGFGAKGDGTTDDTAALAAFLASGATSGYIPPGTYLTSAGCVQPNSMSVTMAPGATIKATASMSVLWFAGASSSPSLSDKVLRGGTLDANNLATTGLEIGYCARFLVSDLVVSSAITYGVHVGTSTAPFNPFEAHLNNVKITRKTGEAMPAGSIGLWIERATDGEYNRVIVVDYETGVRVDTDANRFVQIHPWGHQTTLPVTCFDDRGSRNQWIGCDADTPTTYGWLLGGTQTTILGGRVLANSFATDNQIVGVSSSQASPLFVAIGLRFQGSDSSHRLKNDFAGTGGTVDSTVIGCTATNVVTIASNATVSFGGNSRFLKAVNVLLDSATAFAVHTAGNLTTLCRSFPRVSPAQRNAPTARRWPPPWNR
jgi:hypothetical protein